MTALLIVDMQNDFFPGGALPVITAPEVLPALNNLLNQSFDLIVASKDWHPHDHVSFAVNHDKKPGEKVFFHGQGEQILWPVHCLKDSFGAEFCPGWDIDKVQKIFYKGIDRDVDSYSAFFDNRRGKATGLEEHLRKYEIKNLCVAGVATDYCVLYSVLDALKLGFKTYVIKDACRGVDAAPGDSKRAFEKMQKAGAVIK